MYFATTYINKTDQNTPKKKAPLYIEHHKLFHATITFKFKQKSGSKPNRSYFSNHALR